jgi:hypothetical protein
MPVETPQGTGGSRVFGGFHLARHAFRRATKRDRITHLSKTRGNQLKLPCQAPYTLVRFDKRYCEPCPDRQRRARSCEGRSINFLPHLYELQAARHCLYRGHEKTHVQHVPTAIAINIERLDAHELPDHRPRQPTTFQGHPIHRGYSIPRWWRGTR